MATGEEVNAAMRRTEVALADYLRLPHDRVVAGSFETLESGVVRWRQADDEDRITERAVKLEPSLLRAVIDRAHDVGS